jgi:hypothetical protein
MPPQPFLTIATFPGQVIEISCTRCGRKGVHAKARMARVHGDDTSIPELIRRLSQDCAFRKNAGEAYCRAAVRYPGTPLPIRPEVPANTIAVPAESGAA